MKITSIRSVVLLFKDMLYFWCDLIVQTFFLDQNDFLREMVKSLAGMMVVCQNSQVDERILTKSLGRKQESIGSRFSRYPAVSNKLHIKSECKGFVSQSDNIKFWKSCNKVAAKMRQKNRTKLLELMFVITFFLLLVPDRFEEKASVLLKQRDCSGHDNVNKGFFCLILPICWKN